MDFVDEAQLEIEATLQQSLNNYTPNAIHTGIYCISCGEIIEEERQVYKLARCIDCQIEHEIRSSKYAAAR